MAVVLVSSANADLSGPPGVVFATADGADGARIDACFLSMEIAVTGEIASMAAALDAAPGLSWVHVGWAGVDHPWFAALAARGVTLTSSPGAGAFAVAHHAIGAFIALRRGLVRWSRTDVWEQRDTDDVDGARVVVLGMGPIGGEVARLLVELGADVTGVRRAPRGGEPCRVVPLDELDHVLAGADGLVVALPLTTTTRHLVDRGRLSLLAPGATVVNVGRGSVLDEPALVAALIDGDLGGAALDVFEVEPLPPDSPLWHLPNVLVTPHVAGRTPGTARRARAQFLANLGRWAAGEELTGIVPSGALTR